MVSMAVGIFLGGECALAGRQHPWLETRPSPSPAAGAAGRGLGEAFYVRDDHIALGRQSKR